MDKIKIFCSGACLVHCFFAPIIALVVSPIVFNFIEGEWVHLFLLLNIIPIAIVALFTAAGIFILQMSFIGEGLFKLERILTFAGCAFLIRGHYFNLIYQKDS